jgi:hypothetical protein
LQHAGNILTACDDTDKLSFPTFEQLQLLFVPDNFFSDFIRIPSYEEIFIAEIDRERQGIKDMRGMIPCARTSVEGQYMPRMFLAHIVH